MHRLKNKATDEQINELIQSYLTNDKVFPILYTGKVGTLMRLENILLKGADVKTLSSYPSLNYVTLPECRDGNYLCNDMYSFKMHINIVKIILSNFIVRNPNYFRPITNKKYWASDAFVLDVLLHNEDKGYDPIEFMNLLPLIRDSKIFEIIAETFFIPFEENETMETVRLHYWKESKPFRTRQKNSIACA
jgi:hypothetical protein